ncbi:MAG TPA: alpha/beta hydrolase [Steroidobacteraceae bacterium]|nr:alpha/beta hydrolase [Steroidobacteraceae bacterium]
MQKPTGRIDADGNVHRDAHVVPLPQSVSPEARRYLATPFPIGEDWPATADAAAWKRQIALVDAGLRQSLEAMLPTLPVRTEKRTLGGVDVYVATPHTLTPEQRGRAVLYLHGGGMIVFGGDLVRGQAALSALQFGCTSYAIDYRMPPDHPYPAAVDDCVAAYRALIQELRPAQLVVGGSSAGGNLAAALALRARDEGLPSPAGVVLLTPEVDMTESGDTFVTIGPVDMVLKGGLMSVNLLYAGGHDLKEPYLSPLFADFTRGFPPAFIQAGTRDVFLSNAVRLHRALRRTGIEAELHVWEGMPHGGFGGTAPEDQELREEIQRFLARHCRARRT